MRGTHAGLPVRTVASGIIPAYAGNTRPAFPNRPTSWDHPRVCGEHGSGLTFGLFCTGSSPRMRGTPAAGINLPQGKGIIPAYAGNTQRYFTTVQPFRDHPRVCGEHTMREQMDYFNQGSSPRMRGTRCKQVAASVHHGIIPAYAGNTRFHPFDAIQVGDHPRVCGEHNSISSLLLSLSGSSPRMRGTPQRFQR